MLAALDPRIHFDWRARGVVAARGPGGLGCIVRDRQELLAQLEDEGFVQQPHTSAGRIPTDRGYRFYVDLLLERNASCRTASAVEARLVVTAGALVDSVLSQVSHVVSQASRTWFASASGLTRRRCSIASSSFRSAPRRVLVVIVAPAATSCRKSSRLTSRSA